MKGGTASSGVSSIAPIKPQRKPIIRRSTMNRIAKLLGASALLAVSISAFASETEELSSKQTPNPSGNWTHVPVYPQPWLESWHEWMEGQCENKAQSNYQSCQDSAYATRQISTQQCFFGGGIGYRPAGETASKKACITTVISSYAQDLQQCSNELVLDKLQCPQKPPMRDTRFPTYN